VARNLGYGGVANTGITRDFSGKEQAAGGGINHLFPMQMPYLPSKLYLPRGGFFAIILEWLRFKERIA
jgi:hypothetical protein